jgi:hypothetical protein
MPALSPEQCAELISSTRNAAIAFFEDMQYLREMLTGRLLTRAEIRRASGITRRLLIERDLAKIAAPRTGKVLIKEPDNKPYYKLADAKPFSLALGSR